MQIIAIHENNHSYFEPFLPEITKSRLEQREKLLLLGLEEEGTACGVLCGWWEEDRFFLEHLYVAGSYRRKGGGSLLLKEAVRAVALEKSAVRMAAEFGTACAGHYFLADFLLKRGFTEERDEDDVRAAWVGRLLERPLFQKLAEAGRGKSYAVSSLDPVLKAAFYEHLKRELGIGRKEGRLDEELSAVHLDPQGEPDAYLAMSLDEEQRLIGQEYAYVSPKAPPQTMMLLLACAVQTAKERDMSNYRIYMQPTDERVRQLADFLLGERKEAGSVSLVRDIEEWDAWDPDVRETGAETVNALQDFGG